MSKYPTLSSAPISEAVIEIRTRPPANWIDAEVLQVLKEELPEYSSIQPIEKYQFQVAMKPPHEPSPVSQAKIGSGIKLASHDQLKTVYYWRDMFSFSQQSPYPGWDAFVNEGTGLWERYAALAKPTSVSRIGLRYVNKLLVPPNFSSTNYFSMPVSVPEQLGGEIVNFLHEETIEMPGRNASVRIRRTVGPQAEKISGSTVSILLDIDAYETSIIPVSELDINERLEILRETKNDAFFGSLSQPFIETLK